MNSSTPTPKKITLGNITRRRQEILQDIRDQEQTMTNITHRIFVPLAPIAPSDSSLMRSFSAGMTIFDGVMLGMKVIREVHGLFRERY